MMYPRICKKPLNKDKKRATDKENKNLLFQNAFFNSMDKIRFIDLHPKL